MDIRSTQVKKRKWTLPVVIWSCQTGSLVILKEDEKGLDPELYRFKGNTEL